ncbi:glycosyltransferase family 4 protein [Robiginitalea sp. IMCC44478]|uniref:glycosyltransferase family 4 protein n=1 Tax=Robiginitalea sp. IMCC44478 TaxID=3459122 RepID=UPI004041618A
MKKLIRITTVPISLLGLLKGQCKYMSQYFEVIGISSGGEKLQLVSEEEGIRVIPVEMTRKITPWQDLIALWKLYRIFKVEKPFIVHTHTPKAGTLGMVAARLAKVPYRLHTIAGLPLVEVKGPKRSLLNLVERITYSCATKVYPNSKGLKNIALKNGFAPESKLKVIGNGSSNGIDTEYFSQNQVSEQQKKDLRQSLEISENDFVFVFVGRLVTDKGVNELVTTFEKLSTLNQQVKLLLVGPFEKDLDPLLPKTMNTIVHSDKILFVGWQNDVRPYFAISDCLVFPSYREGFPNVVMQAGAMGLFSIVTDINGCNEIIEDGINGKIVPPKNSEALKSAMELCLESGDDLKKQKRIYRKMIRERYERTFIWKEILNEYRSLES